MSLIVNLKSKIVNQNLSRFDWARIVIGIAFFIQILVSYPLWLTTARTYPFVPILGNTTFEAADFVHILQFGLLLIGAIGLVIFPKRKEILNVFLGVLVLMMILDATRIQAWTYQYLWMLIVLALFSNIEKVIKERPITKKNPKKPKAKKKKKQRPTEKSTKPTYIKKVIPAEETKTYPYFLLALQLIMIFTYCWSGIHKFNIYFNKDTFPWMLSGYAFLEPLGDIPNIGYFAASVELLLGLGLLFHRTRRIAMWLAVAFHLSIIFLLVGLKWNSVVYAWNIAMIALIWILFSNHALFRGNADIPFKTLFRLHKTSWRAVVSVSVVILLFGILPGLNIEKRWDEQLSLKMYSGDSPEAEFYIFEDDENCLPEGYEDKIKEGLYDKELRLDIDHWAFRELKVPAYGGDWAYKRAGYEFCKCLNYPEYAGIEVFKVERWSEETDLKLYPCNKLKREFE